MRYNRCMDIFPINVATGKAFCNRVKERKILKQYIRNGRHCVLIAPRRYGKTSLVNQVLLELKMPYAITELTLVASLKDVESIIVNHVGNLLHSILPKTKKAAQSILQLFKWLNPELVLSASGQKLIFRFDYSEKNSLDNIIEILKKLDVAAKKVNKRVIVVMDEFQQLCEINSSVEAAFRHVMQYSQKVSYVYLGSNRHMLLSMFHDKNRPFYNSCEIMRLSRISRQDYVAFIQNAAAERWGKKLTPKVLEEIFNCSEFYSSYVNRICGYFWMGDKPPTIKAIREYWNILVESKAAEFTDNVLKLSKNQKAVLAYMAVMPTSQPTSVDVCYSLKLSESSIRQALNKLLQLDYLYKNGEGIIEVLDPAFRDYIVGLS